MSNSCNGNENLKKKKKKKKKKIDTFIDILCLFIQQFCR